MTRRRVAALTAACTLTLSAGLLIAGPAANAAAPGAQCVTGDGRTFSVSDETTVTIKLVTRSDGTKAVSVEPAEIGTDDNLTSAPGLRETLPTAPADLPQAQDRRQGAAPGLIKELDGVTAAAPVPSVSTLDATTNGVTCTVME
ncbi:hypothetical protein [Nonomuraea endophytica]|uniref:hypothetical protein n=1 Tax=Nonomuraea endophytica TaxID=714136 RepID=UPI0037C5BE78